MYSQFRSHLLLPLLLTNIAAAHAATGAATTAAIINTADATAPSLAVATGSHVEGLPSTYLLPPHKLINLDGVILQMPPQLLWVLILLTKPMIPSASPSSRLHAAAPGANPVGSCCCSCRRSIPSCCCCCRLTAGCLYPPAAAAAHWLLINHSLLLLLLMLKQAPESCSRAASSPSGKAGDQ